MLRGQHRRDKRPYLLLNMLALALDSLLHSYKGAMIDIKERATGTCKFQVMVLTLENTCYSLTRRRACAQGQGVVRKNMLLNMGQVSYVRSSIPNYSIKATPHTRQYEIFYK